MAAFIVTVLKRLLKTVTAYWDKTTAKEHQRLFYSGGFILLFIVINVDNLPLYICTVRSVDR